MAIEFLPQYMPLFTEADNFVLFSGRSSGKSYHVSASCIWYARRVKINILYIRDYASSNDKSTKAQVLMCIRDMGMLHEWDVTIGEIRHKRTGSIIFFKGIAKTPEC
jgi:phage terminase large subunit